MGVRPERGQAAVPPPLSIALNTLSPLDLVPPPPPPISTFERVANSVLTQFRRSPAAARIAKQADAATDAAARTLAPAGGDPWGGFEDEGDGRSTSSASSHGWRRRSALRLVGWGGDSPRHDNTGGGRYGGQRRTSLEDEAGVASYAALHRPAGRARSSIPPWWVAAGRAVSAKLKAVSAARAAAERASAAAAGRGSAPAPALLRPPRTLLGRWLAAQHADAAARSLTATRAIAARAAWGRRYARANMVGLRKIVKKYGKMCGDPDAGRLLQAFWAGDAEAGTGFLTSPLVAELRVVEVLLSHDRAVTLGGGAHGGVGTEHAVPPADQAATDGVAPADELAAPAPPHLITPPAAAGVDSPRLPPPAPPPEDAAAAAAAAARRASKGKSPLIFPPVPSEPPSDESDSDGGGLPRGRPRPTLTGPGRPGPALTHRGALAPPPLASAWAEPAGGTTSAAAAAAIERGVGVVPFCPDEALFEDDDDDDEDEEDDGDGEEAAEAGAKGTAWYMAGRPMGWSQATTASLAGRSPPRGPASPTTPALSLINTLISPPPSSAGGRGASSAASGSRRAAARGPRHLPRTADAAALDEVLDADAVPSARALSVGSSAASGVASPGQQPPPPASAVSAATAAVRPIAPHLRCPICLDALFRPLGLGCGHCFCTDCALAAVGQGNAVGSLRARLSALDKAAPCPGCRRPGAFIGAVLMLHTSSLVRLRHPKAWAERRAEAVVRARQQRRALDRRAERLTRRWQGRGVTPFDILRVPDTEIF